MRTAGQTADNAERGKIAAESREKGIYDGVQETTEAEFVATVSIPGAVGSLKADIGIDFRSSGWTS